MKYRPTGHAFEDYYLHQVGNGMAVYAGAPMQRGHGIGNVFKGFLRIATPILKSVGRQALKEGVPILKRLGRQALSTGASMVASELDQPHRHPMVRTGAQLLRQVASQKRPMPTPHQKQAKMRRSHSPDIFSQ